MPVAPTPWPEYSETHSEVAAEAMESASSSWQPREYKAARVAEEIETKESTESPMTARAVGTRTLIST